MIKGTLAVAIACLALSGADCAEQKSKKPAKAAEDQQTTPSKKPAKGAAEETPAPQREIPPAAERAQRLTDRMKAQLGLTEEQVPRVAEINLNIAKQVDEIRNAPEGDRGERVNQIRAAQGQRDKELKKILTKEQWEQYKKMQDEMKSNLRERGREFRRQDGDQRSEESIK